MIIIARSRSSFLGPWRTAGRVAAGVTRRVITMSLAAVMISLAGPGVSGAALRVVRVTIASGASLASERRVAGPRVDVEAAFGRPMSPRPSMMFLWSAARGAGRPHGAVRYEAAAGQLQVVAGDLRTRVGGGLFNGIVRPDSDPAPSRLLEIGPSRALGATATGSGSGAGFRWRHGPIESLGWFASGPGPRCALALAIHRDRRAPARRRTVAPPRVGTTGATLVFAASTGERIRNGDGSREPRALAAVDVPASVAGISARVAGEVVLERAHRPAVGGILEARRRSGFAAMSIHRIAPGAAYRATDGTWRRSEGAPRRDLLLRAGARRGTRLRAEARVVDRTTPIVYARSPVPRSDDRAAVLRLHTRTVEATVSGVAGGTATALLVRREIMERIHVRRVITVRLRIARLSRAGLAAELRAAQSNPAAEGSGVRSPRAVAVVLESRRERGADSFGAVISVVPRPEAGASIGVPAETTAGRGTRSLANAAMALAVSFDRRAQGTGGAWRIGFGAIFHSGKPPEVAFAARRDMRLVSRARGEAVERR